jgi:hypothetical protein
VTPEVRAARERKQKIFVVVGGVFLLAMIAFQLPKLLGGSGDSTAASAPAEAVLEQPGAPGPTTPVVLMGTTGRAPAVPGKLTAFGVFKKKNPFVQLVVTEDAASGDAPAGEGKPGAPGSGDSKKFSVDGKSPGPALTIVSVNGSRETVEPGSTFPAADPVFVLVSERPGSKSVVVGVVDGAYSGGSKTAKLEVGKPLTLVNTTTGAKYKIKLVSVGSGDAPDQPTKSK